MSSLDDRPAAGLRPDLTRTFAASVYLPSIPGIYITTARNRHSLGLLTLHTRRQYAPADISCSQLLVTGVHST